MQHQPLLKAIKKAVQENDIKKLLNISYKDWVMVFLHTDRLFLNSFTVGNEYYELYDTNNVLNLNFPIKETVASCMGYYEGEQVINTIERSHEKGLGESVLWPIFFYRSIHEDGKPCLKFELLQDLVHINGLFFDWKRNSFYLKNDVGEIEDRALFVYEDNFKLILLEKKILDYYLGYSNEFLIRFFELLELENQKPWDIQDVRNEELIRRVFQYEGISRFRGAEIIRPSYSLKQIECGSPKKYETFIIQDFKHGVITEWSCAPAELDNYYKDTGKPYETSPAFFNPEVLSKYKNNYEKYEVRERHIDCHGAWSLDSYAINEEGQVHAYIYDLGQLPHKEQLHWKQYNEEPKAGISKVAYNNDFLAEFDEEDCSLRKIKNIFRQFPTLNKDGENYTIWKPKGGDITALLTKLHPVITENKKDYQDFLLNLTILTIDGLDVETLRKLTKSDKTESSLNCLEKLLNNLKSEHTGAIMKSYRTLQRKRSKYAGHGGGKIDFNTKEDYLSTVNQVYEAIQNLVNDIKPQSN